MNSDNPTTPPTIPPAIAPTAFDFSGATRVTTAPVEVRLIGAVRCVVEGEIMGTAVGGVGPVVDTSVGGP